MRLAFAFKDREPVTIGHSGRRKCLSEGQEAGMSVVFGEDLSEPNLSGRESDFGKRRKQDGIGWKGPEWEGP